MSIAWHRWWKPSRLGESIRADIGSGSKPKMCFIRQVMVSLDWWVCSMLMEMCCQMQMKEAEPQDYDLREHSKSVRSETKWRSRQDADGKEQMIYEPWLWKELWSQVWGGGIVGLSCAMSRMMGATFLWWNRCTADKIWFHRWLWAREMPKHIRKEGACTSLRGIAGRFRSLP